MAIDMVNERNKQVQSRHFEIVDLIEVTCWSKIDPVLRTGFHCIGDGVVWLVVYDAVGSKLSPAVSLEVELPAQYNLAKRKLV